MRSRPYSLSFLITLAIALVPTTLLTALGVPYGIPAGIVVSAVALWIASPIPPAATAALIPCSAVLLGVLTPDAAFAPFGSSTIALLLGVFLLVRGLTKFKLDDRIANALIRNRFATASATRLVVMFTLGAWLLGMWMSNTATCALLLPVALGVGDWAAHGMPEAARKNLTARLLLTCAYVPSIGGMMTPIGSIPNAIAIGHLEREGIAPSFLQWVGWAFPISVAMLMLCFAILHLLFPLAGAKLPPRPHAGPPDSPYRFRHEQRVLSIVCGGVVLLWIMPGILPSIGFTVPSIPIALPPLLGAVALFAVRVNGAPLLGADDVSRIDWGTLLFFGGGLCLGQILTSSGAGAVLMRGMYALTGDGALLPLAVAATTVALSEFSSNTATASLIVPLLLETATFLPPDSARSIVLCGVFAAGLGSILPIATPPNALVYGTGKLGLRDMVRAGALLDVGGAIVIALLTMLRMA